MGYKDYWKTRILHKFFSFRRSAEIVISALLFLVAKPWLPKYIYTTRH